MYTLSSSQVEQSDALLQQTDIQAGHSQLALFVPKNEVISQIKCYSINVPTSIDLIQVCFEAK